MPGTDGARRAAFAAERLDRGVEARQVRLLKLVVRALDSRVGNLALTGRPVKFSRLDPGGRDRYLNAWASSRLAQRRAAYHTFRRLLTFLAYADPGPAVTPSARWPAIGYRPDPEPVTSEPTVLNAIDAWAGAAGGGPRGGRIDALELDADVVVVGSGAGGGVVAAELARAGRSVLVVEAGPLVTEPELPTDELAATFRLFLQHGLAATNDGAIQLLAGAAVGGGTLINWATCLPTPAGVRAEWATRHGIEGFDGPEVEDDLSVLRDELGLVPPDRIPAKDDVLLRGAHALGIEAAETIRNAVGCGDCNACTFGCRRGAKRSTLRVHLADASAHGARILAGVRVDQVLVSAARVTGVLGTATAVDGSTRSIRIRANQVVLAAGALRTPGILERSSVGHSAIGRFLRIHPVAAVVGRFAEPIDPWHGALQGARSLAFAPGSDGADGVGGYTIESVPVHPGLLAASVPWESAAGQGALMADARHLSPLIAITRDTDWGRLTPLRSGRARIDYELKSGDIAQLRDGLVQMARIARAAGAESVIAPADRVIRWDRSDADDEGRFEAYLDRLRAFDVQPHRGAVFSAHQMGTARMGNLPGVHVCDPQGRVRWAVAGISANQVIGGLYVADSSLFPTAIGVNPMLTVMLLARRVARTVLAEAVPADS